MIGDFFIWCAGSDRTILKHCPRSERIKHIGFGTLVLIPAILAFVSMTYALSTLDQVREYPILSYLGGLIWALIIFSFDRYIVSTHRRKLSNRDELKSPSFFLRFLFAFILGIVISHPLVLLYFDGSIQDQLQANVESEKKIILAEYTERIETIEGKVAGLDQAYLDKQDKRDAQADLVAREIDGEVLRNANGEIVTTGIYGKGPSAENKIQQLKKLDSELELLRKTDSIGKSALQAEIINVKEERDKAIAAFTLSSDYLKRELALEQLKEKNSIVWITQWFLMALFILVDVLPVTFKTFSPFGMYDKILFDDARIVRELDSADREAALKEVYLRVNRELLKS